MATLNIGGKKVKVGDEFLRMSPEQQNAAVEEIAASIGGAAPAQPSEYDQSLSRASQMSQFTPQAQPTGGPDIMGSTAATLSGIVNGIPVLGPMAQNTSDALIGAGAKLTGGDYAQTVEGLRNRRAELSAANPIADVAGNLAGSVGALGAAGMTATGANALGATGGLGTRVLNSGLSTLGLSTADNMAHGSSPVEAMKSAAGPAALAAAIPVVGAGIKRGAQGVADFATKRAQNALTSSAIVGAPTSTELKSAASQLFESATGGTPIAVSDNAFFRFLGGVKQVADKFRINADNDKQAVGLLNTMMRIADDTADGGTVVDMKDLHLVRQLAGKVAQSAEGRDGEFARLVIRQMDDFIQGLKPADILGGADPSQAANSLMKGISTWSRANKVAAVEEALRIGQMAASGPEKGIRNTLRALMRSDQWSRFNKAEQQAISEVVDGTAGSNLLKLLGTFGFGGNTATNGIGGAAGMALGQMAGGPVGMVLGPVIGSVSRRASEQMTEGLANRALGAVATPNLPIAAQRQVPQILNQGVDLAELLARGGALNAGR